MCDKQLRVALPQKTSKQMITLSMLSETTTAPHQHQTTSITSKITIIFDVVDWANYKGLYGQFYTHQ